MVAHGVPARGDGSLTRWRAHRSAGRQRCPSSFATATIDDLMVYDRFRRLRPIFQAERGDCWRACLATVLGMPLEAVPHFVRDAGLAWLQESNAWLAGFGWHLARRSLRYGSTHLLVAVGVRPSGKTHAVLVDGTGRPVHDPLPGGVWPAELGWCYGFASSPHPIP